jgi:hypothetical protein
VRNHDPNARRKPVVAATGIGGGYPSGDGDEREKRGVAELRDTAIWAATCTLKAQVLANAARRGVRDPGYLMLEADGFTYRLPGGLTTSRQWSDCGEFSVARSVLRRSGHVTWSARDGDRGGAFLPGAADLPAEDLAVLLGRYRERFAP